MPDQHGLQCMFLQLLGYADFPTIRTALQLFYVSFTFLFILLTLMMSCCRLVIGLFGLVGMGGVAMAPVAGRAIDRLVPWYGTLIA